MIRSFEIIIINFIAISMYGIPTVIFFISMLYKLLKRSSLLSCVSLWWRIDHPVAISVSDCSVWIRMFVVGAIVSDFQASLHLWVQALAPIR